MADSAFIQGILTTPLPTTLGGTGLSTIGSSLQVLRVNSGGTALEYATSSGTGTVTSVSATVPTGLTISGSPVTTSGTLAIGLDTGRVIPLQSTIDGKVPYTGATANVDLGIYDLITDTITAKSSSGLILENATGGDVLHIGNGGGVNATAYGGWNFDAVTASRVAQFNASKTLESSSVTNTELGYVSGVTSSIQTQLNAKGSGTVTSVGWTGGIVSVGTPTTTPAFTIAGTSGGIPYFSSGTTWATSAALAANALVVGGGAGVAPATITTGANVLTALGVAVGSAGAFVTFNGALGTPSSGTVTNLTGTASININGTVGATTPTTGAFTTVVGNSFVPNSATVPSNGMYLPSANVLGWSASTTAEMAMSGTALYPATNDGLALGIASTNAWADLFLAAGGVINFDNGDITITEGTNVLTFAGATTNGYQFQDGPIRPVSNDGIALGAATASFSDLFLAEGGVINWDNGDATLTQVGNDVTLAGASLTARIKRRVGTTTSSATPTINTDDVDYYSLTAQTVDITSFTTNLTGTPTDAQTLWISITGTAARAITWGASFEASTVALPTTTVTTNRLDVGFVWNAATSKWRCVASC